MTNPQRSFNPGQPSAKAEQSQNQGTEPEQKETEQVTPSYLIDNPSVYGEPPEPVEEKD